MEEQKVMIEFTVKELDYLLEYQKEIEADTLQEAIMNAVRIVHEM